MSDNTIPEIAFGLQISWAAFNPVKALTILELYDPNMTVEQQEEALKEQFENLLNRLTALYHDRGICWMEDDGFYYVMLVPYFPWQLSDNIASREYLALTEQSTRLLLFNIIAPFIADTEDLSEIMASIGYIAG